MTPVRVRRWVLLATAQLIVAGLVISAPARASQLSWPDQIGDGHYQSEATGPIPVISEAAWDLTAARVESDGNRFMWELSLLDIEAARPSHTSGGWYLLNFQFGSAQFQMSVIEADGALGVEFGGWNTGPAGAQTGLPCPDCRAVRSTSSNTVAVHTSVATLARGARLVDRSARMGPGSVLRAVRVGAGPTYDYPDGRHMFSHVHDTSHAPSPGSIQL